MTFSDYLTRNIPEYYPTMYQDGYEPWQIWEASRKRARRMIAERAAKQKAVAQVDDYNIHITSEVKVK